MRKSVKKVNVAGDLNRRTIKKIAVLFKNGEITKETVREYIALFPNTTDADTLETVGQAFGMGNYPNKARAKAERLTAKQATKQLNLDSEDTLPPVVADIEKPQQEEEEDMAIVFETAPTIQGAPVMIEEETEEEQEETATLPVTGDDAVAQQEEQIQEKNVDAPTVVTVVDETATQPETPERKEQEDNAANNNDAHSVPVIEIETVAGNVKEEKIEEDKNMNNKEIPVATTTTIDEEVEKLFNHYFFDDPAKGTKRYDYIINNMVNAAYNSKYVPFRGCINFISLYMAENAITMAIWCHWRKNVILDDVKQDFVNQILNELVKEHVLTPVYKANGALKGFMIRPEVMLNVHGEGIVYTNRKNGAKYALYNDKVVCLNTKEEAELTVNWLNYLAKLNLTGKLGKRNKQQANTEAATSAKATDKKADAVKTVVNANTSDIVDIAAKYYSVASENEINIVKNAIENGMFAKSVNTMKIMAQENNWDKIPSGYVEEAVYHAVYNKKRPDLPNPEEIIVIGLAVNSLVIAKQIKMTDRCETSNGTAWFSAMLLVA